MDRPGHHGATAALLFRIKTTTITTTASGGTFLSDRLLIFIEFCQLLPL